MKVGNNISVKLKLPCIIVGVSHLILICLSLYEKIWELIKLEEPFHIEDYTILLISYIAQFLCIVLLLFGTATGNSYYVIPWLICTAPLFFAATTYALLYTSQEETSQIVLNFIVVGIIWSAWYTVMKFHLRNRSRSR